MKKILYIEIENILYPEYLIFPCMVFHELSANNRMNEKIYVFNLEYTCNNIT